MNKFLWKIKTWWHRSLYGYTEKRSNEVFDNLSFYYPNLKSSKFIIQHKPKLWGKIIVWIKNNIFRYLFRFISILIVSIVVLIWSVSGDLIKEKLKVLFSPFIDRLMDPYVPNYNSGDKSHDDTIIIPGTIKASEKPEGVSTHTNEPQDEKK